MVILFVYGLWLESASIVPVDFCFGLYVPLSPN